MTGVFCCDYLKNKTKPKTKTTKCSIQNKREAKR